MVYSLETSSMSARSGSANVYSDVVGNSNGGTNGRRNRRKRSKKALFIQDNNRQLDLSVVPFHSKSKEPRRFELPSHVLQAYATCASYKQTQDQEENIAPRTNFEVIKTPDSLLTLSIIENFKFLHSRELFFHPKTDFLFRINAACEDKVDAALRDEAIFNLRFLHKFNNLSSKSFADAVNITDRFIVKVKVKPKYMACVATAAYFIATKMNEDLQDQMSAERLVTMARCGGTSNDLERMEAIIRTKLGDNNSSGVTVETAVTPLSFLLALKPLFTSESSFQCAVGELETAVCSVAIYRFTPAQIALALAAKFFSADHSFVMAKLTELCEITENDLDKCQDELAAILLRMPNRSPSPRTLTWNLSRRTLTSLQKPSAGALGSLLDPIREDLVEEETWDWEISRLFD